MTPVPAPFVFRPDRVHDRLSALPTLAAHLNPRKEGFESRAFDGWRTSERQIYMPLANVEGVHGFDDLLERIDHWLARGFGGKALRARDRASFRSALAELEVADHFDARGFEVSGLDETKGSASTADIRVERDELRATVEVFSPVEWEGLDYFKADAWDTLRQLDLPFDYLFHFDVSQQHPFTAGDAYRQLHPEELTRDLDTLAKRRRILQPLFDEAAAQLEVGRKHVLIERQDGDLNITLRLELEHVRPLREFRPREGSHGGPGVGGYRPEVIFRDVIGRGLAKARKGQARAGDGSLAVFVVDVSRLPLESEFDHPTYQALFREILQESLPADATLPVDVFALCRSRGWCKQLHAHYVVRETDSLSREQCEELFGPLG